jgi:branched-chain amino acid transport system permease protein
MQIFLQLLANGVIAGSTVALLAVSYSLIYSILRFINFVFGEVLMVGAFSFYAVVHLGYSAWLAGLAVVATLGFVGALIQIGAYRPFYRQSRLACLITALGASIILQNAVLFWLRGGPVSLIEIFPGTVLRLGGVAVTYVQIIIFFVALALLGLVDLFVFRSMGGLRIRALADNLSIAEVLGVRVDRAILAVFFIGSCLAAFAGVLLSFENLVTPTMGISPGIQAFAACVVGGIGSVRGAVGAAFAIAILGHFVSFMLPTVAPETTAYAVLLLALALFPHGVAAGFGSVSKRGRHAAETTERSV